MLVAIMNKSCLLPALRIPLGLVSHRLKIRLFLHIFVAYSRTNDELIPNYSEYAKKTNQQTHFPPVRARLYDYVENGFESLYNVNVPPKIDCFPKGGHFAES